MLATRRDRDDPRGGAEVPVTHDTTMASVCHGGIPVALNTPRSCARSLICNRTVFSTPSPATAMSSAVSRDEDKHAGEFWAVRAQGDDEGAARA